MTRDQLVDALFYGGPLLLYFGAVLSFNLLKNDRFTAERDARAEATKMAREKSDEALKRWFQRKTSRLDFTALFIAAGLFLLITFIFLSEDTLNSIDPDLAVLKYRGVPQIAGALMVAVGTYRLIHRSRRI